MAGLHFGCFQSGRGTRPGISGGRVADVEAKGSHARIGDGTTGARVRFQDAGVDDGQVEFLRPVAQPDFGSRQAAW